MVKKTFGIYRAHCQSCDRIRNVDQQDLCSECKAENDLIVTNYRFCYDGLLAELQNVVASFSRKDNRS
jgi:hypothetical protein